MQFRTFTFAVLVCAVIITGCSAGNGAPVMPGTDSPGELTGGISNTAANANHPALWGVWDVMIDTSDWTVEIVPVRGAQYTVDVVTFMQPPGGPPSSLGIVILDTTEWLTEGYLPVEVSLTHPFPGLDQYTGSDVRGVFITNGNAVLSQDTDLTMSDRGIDDPWLSNPDGYTRWMNPEEFTEDGSIFTFKPGMLGNQENFDGTLNGYKYFTNGLDPDVALSAHFSLPSNLENRGQFTASSTCKRDYELYFPLIGGSPEIGFQYAVIASWAEPVDLDPYDLPGSFPVEANAQEAFCAKVIDNGTLYYTTEQAGGDILLDIEIFDWAPYVNGTGSVLDEIDRVIIESPQGILPTATVIFDQAALASTAIPGSGGASSIVSIEILDCLPVDVMDQEVIISVQHSGDVGYDNYGAGTNYPDATLASYFFHTLNVSSIIPQSDEPVVTEIDPDHGIPDTYLYDIVITGENFDGVTEVKLVGDTEEFLVENMVIVDEFTINCELDLEYLSIGLYDVVATDPANGVGTLEDGYELMDCPSGIHDQFDAYTTTSGYTDMFVAGVLTSGTYADDIITQWGHSGWARVDVADPPTDNTWVGWWVNKPSLSGTISDWSWSLDTDPLNEVFAYTTFDDDDDSGTWPDTQFDFVKICSQEDGSYLGACDTDCGYAVAQVDFDEYGNLWAVCSNGYVGAYDFTLQRWDYDELVPDPHYTFVNEWDISDIISDSMVISDIVVLQRYRRLYISHSPSSWGVNIDCWDISGTDPVWLNSTTMTVSGFYGTNSFNEVHQRFVDMEVDRTDDVLAGCRILVMFMGEQGTLRTLELRKFNVDLDMPNQATLDWGSGTPDHWNNFVLDDQHGGRVVTTISGYAGVAPAPTDW